MPAIATLPTPVVTLLDAADPGTAAQMLALWRLSQAQEAGLLGLLDMQGAGSSVPAMPESGGDGVLHLGLDGSGRLAGLLTLRGDTAAACQGAGDQAMLNIETLVVNPALQRRGIASALLRDVLQRWPSHDITVTTAVANAPALALYAGFGFKPERLGRMGATALPVVQLLRCAGR